MQKLELTERTDEQMTDPCIGSVISRFASRGLAETARTEAEKQIEREERIRRDAPIAYRMSGSADGADAYRENGVMTEEGLLRYAGENRAMRVEGKDFVGDAVGIYAVAEAHALEPAVKKPTAMDTVRQAGEVLKKLPAQTVDNVKKRSPLWCDPRKGTTENEKRRFPLSAFAAVAAVAISMMLIVAGSLMVIGAETQIPLGKRPSQTADAPQRGMQVLHAFHLAQFFGKACLHGVSESQNLSHEADHGRRGRKRARRRGGSPLRAFRKRHLRRT